MIAEGIPVEEEAAPKKADMQNKVDFIFTKLK